MGCSIADAKTYYKKGSASIKVAIGAKVGIKASSSKDVFRLSLIPLLLYGALSY
jgi:hypothetical protein